MSSRFSIPRWPAKPFRRWEIHAQIRGNRAPAPCNLPDWQSEDRAKSLMILDSPDWIALPTKRDLGEYDIMARFCAGVADEDRRERLLDAIDGRGAFQRFERLIHRTGIQQQWYDFRGREVECAVADWLEAEGIPYER